VKFEELIPYIRKGRKFRRSSWKPDKYIFFERDVPDWGDVLTDQDGISDNFFAFETKWIIDDTDDWELVPEPVRVADYFVPIPQREMLDHTKGWFPTVLKYHSTQACRANDVYYRDTFPVGQQPKGSVLVLGSEREQE